VLEATVCGDTLPGCRTNFSDMLAENNGLLSLSLSSKGGEGNSAAAWPVWGGADSCEHRSALNCLSAIGVGELESGLFIGRPGC
jgi:hypothetical protein